MPRELCSAAIVGRADMFWLELRIRLSMGRDIEPMGGGSDLL